MKIIILLLSGIGNTLMFTPALRLLRKNYPKSQIDALVMHKGSAEILKNNPHINKIFYYPLAKKGHISSFLFMLKFSRKNKYDLCINAFPSNQKEFNIISFMTKAKTRLTHKYEFGKISTFSFLQDKKVNAKDGISDIEQNINLLKELKIEKPKKINFSLDIFLTPEENEFALKYLKRFKKRKIIGIHAGSGASYKKGFSFASKRWPKQYFIQLINAINKNPSILNQSNHHTGIQLKNKKFNQKIKKQVFTDNYQSNANQPTILLFGGPEELRLNQQIKQKTRNTFIIRESIRKTSALISQCDFFITNDSGLMHIAEAFNIPMIAIFGPTNYIRVQPHSKKAGIMRKSLYCSPCFKYPLTSTKANIKCILEKKDKMKCLRDIKPDEIINKIQKDLKNFNKTQKK